VQTSEGDAAALAAVQCSSNNRQRSLFDF